MIDRRSESRLQGVDKGLASLARMVIESWPHASSVIITEGMRTMDRQRQLVAAGKSKTLNSKHLTGHAIDFCVVDVTGKASWRPQDYDLLARHVAVCAEIVGIRVRWGGSWQWLDTKRQATFARAKFFDGPHFEV